MNVTSVEDARKIFKSTKAISEKLKTISVVLCPPFVYIPTLLNTRSESSVAVGAQNVFFENQGSFTGEISPLMLKDMGAEYCIVGHSERRAMGETDEIISKKVQALLEVGVKPIVCFGEAERNENGSHLEFLRVQIKNSLNKVQKKFINNLIVAYEPIWAIGAKEAMKPEDIYEMSIFIKKVLSDIYGHDEAISTPVLYGGSVNFRNAAEIFEKGKVDGLLIGRESVNVPGFGELMKAVEEGKTD